MLGFTLGWAIPALAQEVTVASGGREPGELKFVGSAETTFLSDEFDTVPYEVSWMGSLAGTSSQGGGYVRCVGLGTGITCTVTSRYAWPPLGPGSVLTAQTDLVVETMAENDGTCESPADLQGAAATGLALATLGTDSPIVFRASVLSGFDYGQTGDPAVALMAGENAEYVEVRFLDDPIVPGQTFHMEVAYDHDARLLTALVTSGTEVAEVLSLDSSRVLVDGETLRPTLWAGRNAVAKFDRISTNLPMVSGYYAASNTPLETGGQAFTSTVPFGGDASDFGSIFFTPPAGAAPSPLDLTAVTRDDTAVSVDGVRDLNGALFELVGGCGENPPETQFATIYTTLSEAETRALDPECALVRAFVPGIFSAAPGWGSDYTWTLPPGPPPSSEAASRTRYTDSEISFLADFTNTTSEARSFPLAFTLTRDGSPATVTLWQVEGETLVPLPGPNPTLSFAAGETIVVRADIASPQAGAYALQACILPGDVPEVCETVTTTLPAFDFEILPFGDSGKLVDVFNRGTFAFSGTLQLTASRDGTVLSSLSQGFSAAPGQVASTLVDLEDYYDVPGTYQLAATAVVDGVVVATSLATAEITLGGDVMIFADRIREGYALQIPFLILNTGNQETTYTVAWSLSPSGWSTAFSYTLDACTTPAQGGMLTIDSLPPGAYTLTAEMSWPAGSSTVTQVETFTINVLRKPTVALTSTPPPMTTQTTAVFAFEAVPDPLAIIVAAWCSVDMAPFAPCDSFSSHTVVGLSSGQHVFQVWVMDDLGQSSAAAGYGWFVDSTGPILSVITTPDPACLGENFTVTVKSSELVAGLPAVTVGEINPFALEQVGVLPEYRATFNTSDRNLLGRQVVRATATDALGNLGTATGSVLIGERGQPLGQAPCRPNTPGCPNQGDDVNVTNGNFSYQHQDYRTIALMPMDATRAYNSKDKTVGIFGTGWRWTYESRLTLNLDLSMIETRELGAAYGYTFVPDDPEAFVDEFDGDPLIHLPLDQGIWTAGEGHFGTLVRVDATTYVATDPSGNKRTYAGYHAPWRADQPAQAGKLVRIEDRNGNALTLTHDDLGRVATVTDSSGHAMTLEYNGDGFVALMTDWSGRQWNYTYENGDLAAVAYPHGATSGYGYDDNHNLTSLTDLKGMTYHYEYDLQEGGSAAGGQESGAADGTGNCVKLIDGSGHEVRFVFDFDARRTTMIDQLGGETVTTYDENGNVLSVTDPTGATTTYTHNADFQITSITDPNGHTTSFEYDDRGNVTRATDALGNSTFATYDSTLNRPLLVTGTDGATTSFSYDNRGNLLAVTDAAGETLRYTVDSRGLPVSFSDRHGHTWQMQYAENGNLLAQEDPLGKHTLYEYDAISRVASFTNARGFVTRLDYDSADRLIQRSDPLGQVTSLFYDSAGKLEAMVDPAGRATVFEYESVNFGYKLARAIRADGSGGSVQYDLLGRPLFATDAAGRTTRIENDAAGRRTKMVSADGAVWSFGYDAAGNLVATTDPRGYTTRFELDALGRVAAVVDPAGGVTQYDLDAAGNIVALVDANGHRRRWT